MKPRLFLGLLLGLSFWGHQAAGQRPAVVVIPPVFAPPPVDELVIANVNVVDVDLGEIEPHRNVVLRGRLFTLPALAGLAAEAEKEAARQAVATHAATAIR